ncbi:MAG: response regulator transcription factor [Anaerolineae bacterium]
MAEVPLSSEADQEARLLIVDDEPSLRAGLRDLLSAMGYHVEEAASGHEALELLENAPYDLMVLDIRMPGMSGVEVMHRARRMYPDLSIVVLTAHASVESAIAAVKSDAADYILKPFDVEDLTTTIARALQERTGQLRSQRLLDLIGETLGALGEEESPATPSFPPPMSLERFLTVDLITLDRQKRLAVVQGDPSRTVELSEGEAAILAILMENANQVFSCSELARAAVGCDLDEHEAQNQVRLYIYRLRRKIEANPRKPHLICTVRGRGYFFSPD